MPQFLMAIHHPDDFLPASEEAATINAINDLNKEMVAEGVRAFVCGLKPVSDAKSVTSDANGKITVTDGSHVKGSEHMVGFWVLECEDMGKAVDWARKATLACPTAVEVRELLQKPPKEKTKK